MKVIIVALALVAIAAAAPADLSADAHFIAQHVAKILRASFEPHASGGYAFGFESDNGITRDETGEIKEVVDEEKNLHPVVIVRGSYSYTNDKGEPELVEYYADETGYHAQGASIPKPISPVV